MAVVVTQRISTHRPSLKFSRYFSARRPNDAISTVSPRPKPHLSRPTDRVDRTSLGPIISRSEATAAGHPKLRLRDAPNPQPACLPFRSSLSLSPTSRSQGERSRGSQTSPPHRRYQHVRSSAHLTSTSPRFPVGQFPRRNASILAD